jgi:hypothetical protein
MNKNKTILLILLLVIISILAWKFIGENSPQLDTTTAVTADPVDAAVDLYQPWLAALQATSTEPNFEALLAAAPLTGDLRARLVQEVGESTIGIDPVICLADVPERLGTKVVFVDNTQAELMVVARGEKSSQLALYTLEWMDGSWLITGIDCSAGEVAPVQEFSFEREGNLLRESLQAPLDSSQWHLIYTKDEVSGHAVPLLFDESSICITDTEVMCDVQSFTEATAVTIQGSLQEAGALVQRMEFN